jgi:hypothetical protein
MKPQEKPKRKYYPSRSINHIEFPPEIIEAIKNSQKQNGNTKNPKKV